MRVVLFGFVIRIALGFAPSFGLSLALGFGLSLTSPAVAQDFSGLARVDIANSAITDEGDDIVIDLRLSQTVPYRVFTRDTPRRLIVDFREVDWTGVTPASLLRAKQVQAIRFGSVRPGWSRLVVDLNGPMALHTAGIAVDPTTQAAALSIRLVPSDPQSFADRAGLPDTPGWDVVELPDQVAPAPQDGPLTVVIDPGHGGIDPGAERGGVKEADLMLSLAIEVADVLNRDPDIRALLTRDSDRFVPLEARMTFARQAGADLLISLHADALTEGTAHGASVYTLNQDGSDRASQRMAERHERGDLLAGLDLTGQDDRVATVLMDLARAENAPAGERFADTLVAAFRQSGASLNSRPRRDGRLAVLMAADFPSVLVEVGFLSSNRDRAVLQTPAGRRPIVAGVFNAVRAWARAEAAQSELVRQ